MLHVNAQGMSHTNNNEGHVILVVWWAEPMVSPSFLQSRCLPQYAVYSNKKEMSQYHVLTIIMYNIQPSGKGQWG